MRTTPPPSFPPPRKRCWTHTLQTPEHESSQLNSPGSIVHCLLGKAAHSSATAQVQPFSCENRGEVGAGGARPSRVPPSLAGGGQKRCRVCPVASWGRTAQLPRPLATRLPSRHVRRVCESLGRPHLQAVEPSKWPLPVQCKAGEPPRLSSQTAFLPWNLKSQSLIVTSNAQMWFNKAVAYDPTPLSQFSVTHNLSSNTKRH